MNPIPDAAIMAAGRGNRLMPLTHDCPKCLLEVGNAPILVHQLRICAACGVPSIQIVTGHGAGLVIAACNADFGSAISFAHNADFDGTNSLFSLGCVALDSDSDSVAERGLLILNSDVLFHPGQMRALLDDPRANVLLASFGGTMGEEEMKIRAGADDRITAIGKRIDPKDAQAENLGVLKVGPEAAARLLALARQPGEVHGHSWIPDAINSLLVEIEFYALPAEAWPWIEIDFPCDLERARNEIWPLIAPALEALR